MRTKLRATFEILSLTAALTVAAATAPAADDKGQPASVLPHLNQLTDGERAAGWKLLFDGRTTTGWRNFKKTDVSQGWQVIDGALCRVEKSAGDIITTEQYDNFVLELDYKVPPHANSGLMFRVSEDEARAPFTGVEFQLLDNTDPNGDSQKSGWAYALYQPPLDPQTGKPSDATKPVGQWNHVRLACDGPHIEHWMNGVKYCQYEIGSDDFQQRVANSKFAKWPKFAKYAAGHIALQGDHGDICFANIKLRPLLAKPVKTDLFAAGEDGYATYRIPGIVVTGRGTILAYCAARKDGIGDWADIDIALRRSTDGGRSWQPRQILVDAGKATADNPTAIVDRKTGAVHFLYQVNYARCFYMRSDDDGQTVTPAVEITSVFERFRQEYDWNVIAPGPGHGIQLDNGRLLVPVWLSTGGHSHRPSCVSVIYSDDHGVAWHRGEVVTKHSDAIPNPSETLAMQLCDGRVMLNIRNESRRYRRLIAFSADGATRWTEPVFDENLFEPVCMASLIRVGPRPGDTVSRILFANPDSRSNAREYGWCRARENLSIKASEDEGRTWRVSRVLEPGISGYSDLAAAPDGTVYCFYERGGLGSEMFHTQYLTVARFPVSWLDDGSQE